MMHSDRKNLEPTLLPIAKTFTDVHKRGKTTPPAIRELKCLETLFPHVLLGPQEDDYLAGRITRGIVGLSNVHYPEKDEVDIVGYYFDKHKADRIFEESGEEGDFSRNDLDALEAYWKKETSYRKIVDSMDAPMGEVLFTQKVVSQSTIAHRLHRIASPSLDFSVLLKLGILGYKQHLKGRLKNIPAGKDPNFLKAAIGYMDLFLKIIDSYCAEFQEKSVNTENPTQAMRWRKVVKALTNLKEHPPANFFESVQLVHLYTVVGYTPNAIGRLDDDLGPFLLKDLETRKISREEATALLVNYWQLLCEHFMNSRLTIGGKGRRNPKAADVFCELALEATRIFYTEKSYHQDRAWQLCLVPQVAFRQSSETPEHLRKQAIDVIGSGCTFPILYNDEVNVPEIAKAFAIPEEEAEQYTFFDCGEYIIHGKSIGTPSTIINMPKALEVALHNGIDPRTGKQLGPKNPNGSDFLSYEEVETAYKYQIEHAITQCARFQKHQFDQLNEDCAFLAMSVLMEGCLESGQPMLNGGCPYLGGTLESYGNITTADSLYAIQTAVFQKKWLSLEALIRHLDSDFIGGEDLCQKLLDLPKFGNDHDEVDRMAVSVHDHICEFTRDSAKQTDLHHFLIVVINNGSNVVVGHHVNASADGRRSGMPVSNGNTPTPGRDISGITALLNSILKLPAHHHGGAVHNLRFSRKTLTQQRQFVDTLIANYWKRGGTQIMITITSREELEDAIKHPENYGHLLVRVGGYSARFIDLPKDLQEEILQRNAY